MSNREQVVSAPPLNAQPLRFGRVWNEHLGVYVGARIECRDPLGRYARTAEAKLKYMAQLLLFPEKGTN